MGRRRTNTEDRQYGLRNGYATQVGVKLAEAVRDASYHTGMSIADITEEALALWLRLEEEDRGKAFEPRPGSSLRNPPTMGRL